MPLLYVESGTPYLGALTTVKNTQHYDFLFADDIKHSIRKPAEERAVQLGVNLGIGLRVANDSDETSIESLPKLQDKVFALFPIPRVYVTNIRLCCRSEANPQESSSRESRTASQVRPFLGVA